MKIEIKKYLQYLFLVVLFLGAIQPGYANDLGELQSEKLAEKSAQGTDVFKSWEVQYDAGNTTLIKNPVSLQKLSDLISNPNLTSSNLTEDLVRRAIKGNRGKSTWQLLLYFGEGFLGSEIATILGCAGGGIISGALDYCLSSDFTVEGLFGVVSFQIKAVIVQCTFAPKIGKFVQRIKFKFPSFEQIPYNTLARKIIQFTDELGQNLLNVNFRKIPKLVKAWKGLSNRLPWVRTNTDLLEKLAGKGDDYIAKVDELYSPTVMKLPANLKPPNGSPPGSYNGIDYDKFGFPKLESHVFDNGHVVKIAMDGTNDDYIRAYDKLKEIVGEGNIQFTNQYGSSFKIRQADGTFDGPAYTWHHHQDGESMMPVLQAIHQSIQSYHTGGRAVVNRGLEGLFDPPQL